METTVILLISLCLFFITAYSLTLLKLFKLTKEFSKLFISHESLKNFVEKKDNQFKNENDIHKDNFIKFLSDSRDWAFTYIEDVQKGLTQFVNEVDPTIKYFLEFSTITEGQPLNDGMKKISTAYKDLKSFLPDDLEKNNT